MSADREKFKIPEKCPYCGIDDFDISMGVYENGRKGGFCLAGCGGIFEFDREGNVYKTDEVIVPVVLLP